MQILPIEKAALFHARLLYLYPVLVIETIIKFWIGWFTLGCYSFCLICYSICLFNETNWSSLLLAVAAVPCVIVELWRLMECIKNQSKKNETLQIALTFLFFIFMQYIMILALARWIFLYRNYEGNLQEQLEEERYMFGGEGPTTGDIKTNDQPQKLSQFGRQQNAQNPQEPQKFFTGAGVTIGGTSR